MMSSLWSLTPWSSLYQGLQLLMTLARGLLGCLAPRYETSGSGSGFGPGARRMRLSYWLSRYTPPTAIAEDGTWIGVYPHKNVLGSMMVLQIISCVVLVMDGRHRRLAALLILPAAVLLLRLAVRNVAARPALSLAVVPPALCYRRGTTTLRLSASVWRSSEGRLWPRSCSKAAMWRPLSSDSSARTTR